MSAKPVKSLSQLAIEFNDARQRYWEERKSQCTYIARLLRGMGFEEVQEYPNQKYRDEKTPLWMEVSGVINKNKVHIRLQSYDQDQDPKSKNEHVLLDRISIGIGEKPGDKQDSDWLHVTELELPIDGEIVLIKNMLELLLPAAVDGSSDLEKQMKSKFREARESYEKVRAEQRNKIVKCLRERDYKKYIKEVENGGELPVDKNLTTAGGAGHRDYKNTKDRTLTPPHDLRNWKWIDATRKDGVTVCVMLQSFKEGSVEGDSDVDFDQISIDVVDVDDTKPNCRNLRDMKRVPGVTLPFDEEGVKMKKLVDELNNLIDKTKEQREALKAAGNIDE